MKPSGSRRGVRSIMYLYMKGELDRNGISALDAYTASSEHKKTAVNGLATLGRFSWGMFENDERSFLHCKAAVDG
jgi:hypothetical protein